MTAEERRPRVLVAEDDPAICRVLQAHLSRMGCEVIVANDGLAAIDALSQSPELVCLDLALPVVSGWEVCRRIRSTEETRTLPVLILTGRDGLDDHAAALEAGADVFLLKPFRAKEFTEQVKTLLQLHTTRNP